VNEPCHHVRHIRGDGLDLRGELVPLGEETIGVGEVTDVEHGVVVGQVLDQPIGGHLRPGLEAGELVAPVTLPLPNENASSFTHDGWMATPATKKTILHKFWSKEFLRVPCHRRQLAGASPGQGKVLHGRRRTCPVPRFRLAAHAQSGKNT
jgi:hypothetical protein